MINIYAVELWKLSLIAVCVMFAWQVLSCYSKRTSKSKKGFGVISMLLTAAAVYGIFSYTVLHRNPGETHQFVLVNHYNNEFFRELFMNGLLYLPLGMGLSTFLGPWAILVAFLMSAGIEAWQYLAGTGLAQGTDVLMNTLGAAIGIIPHWVAKKSKGDIQEK